MAFHASCVECEFEASAKTVDEALNRQVDHHRACDSEHVFELEAKQVD